MTLTTSNTYTQYQKTEMQYEAKISKVLNNQLEEEKKEQLQNDIQELDSPIVYTNESELSNIETIRKQLLEKVLGGFNQNGSHSLYPQGNYEKESHGTKNPYNKEIPASLFYTANSEYYEKISFEFSAQVRIKTPEGEYNIDLKFSFTQEYYEKNETQIKFAQDKFTSPFDIELDKEDESLKELKYLHFIFASYKEEKSEKHDIFEQLKEFLTQKDKIMLDIIKDNELEEKEDEKRLDNFKIWQENSNKEVSLIAIQKDGLGIFVANNFEESSTIKLATNENKISLESNYSASEIDYFKATKEIKA